MYFLFFDNLLSILPVAEATGNIAPSKIAGATSDTANFGTSTAWSAPKPFAAKSCATEVAPLAAT